MNEQENKRENRRVARVRRQNQISPNKPYQSENFAVNHDSVSQNNRRRGRERRTCALFQANFGANF